MTQGVAILEKFMLDAGIGGGGMPDDIAEQIRSGLRKRFDNPPIVTLESNLQRSISVLEARQLLFNPSEEDMKLYPALLAFPSEEAGQEHPQFKCMVVALTHIYLGHSKRLDLMRPFIEAGGLLSLVKLITHPNLHVAAQAMNSLLDITDEGMYPWHEPPMSEDGQGPMQGPDKLIWMRMFELSRSPFIASLLKHQPDTFPGSSHLALRLLAFYTSWLRCHFTPNGILRLSSELLNVLQEWSNRDSGSEAEKQLAKQLHADFSRFPPAEAPSAPQLGADVQHTTVQGGPGWDDDSGCSVVHDRTQVNSYTPSEAERLKAAGNAAYGEARYSDAIRLYSDALDVPVPAEQLVDEGPRRAVYHANRAAAYLGRVAAGPLRQGVYDDRGLLEGLDHGEPEAQQRHWEAALLDAGHALDLDPSYAKAYLRKAQALLKLQRLGEAFLAAKAGQQRAAAANAASVARDLATLVQELEAMATQHQASQNARPSSSQPESAPSPSPSTQAIPGQAASGPNVSIIPAACTDDILSELAQANTMDEACSFTCPSDPPAPPAATAAAARSASSHVLDVGHASDHATGAATSAAATGKASKDEEALDLYAMD